MQSWAAAWRLDDGCLKSPHMVLNIEHRARIREIRAAPPNPMGSVAAQLFNRWRVPVYGGCLYQQATAEAAANGKVTIESLSAEAEAARVKAMAGGGAAAVSALTSKAKACRHVA